MTATDTRPVTATVTTDAASLLRALANVALFASTDGTLPVICAVRLTAARGKLTAEATDRYVYATETLPAPDDAALDVLTEAGATVAAVKTLAAALKASARLTARLAEQPVITISQDGIYARLTLSGHLAPDQSVTIPVVEGDFPKTAAKMLATYEKEGGKNSNGHVSFSAKHLAKIAKVTDDTGTKYEHGCPIQFTLGGPSKPAVVHVGSTFRALSMPVREAQS